MGVSINNSIRINQEIRSPQLRIIGADGEQLGIMSRAAALQAAEEAGLDLVEISPNAEPPVAKIIDWGKYQYQKIKEQQRNKRSSRASELKQIKIGLKIGQNDLNIKLKKIREFLTQGDQVKIIIVFRGREMAHQEVGSELATKIINILGDEIIVESHPQFAGRNLSVTVRSNNAKTKKP